MAEMIFVQWLISDLIPKKHQKLRLRNRQKIVEGHENENSFDNEMFPKLKLF